MDKKLLNNIADSLVADSKGILAADESTGTITKRFDQINLESNFENRRMYREILFSTPDLEKFISGIIFYDETIRQNDSNNLSFVNLLRNKGILVGIKVDKGAKKLFGTDDETITEGLDELPERIEEYKNIGASFTKWRAVIKINIDKPSTYCIKLNAHALARYARIVQEFGLVPIIEPEVLMDGSHTLERCYEVTSEVLKIVFDELIFQRVFLGGILLKPNMILPGESSKKASNAQEIASSTIKCLTENVPDEVPGIVFLSGGQSNIMATKNLNEMNKVKNLPFRLSYSYGRALQQPVITSWLGKSSNIQIAQDNLYLRSKLNSLACIGEYKSELEKTN